MRQVSRIEDVGRAARHGVRRSWHRGKRAVGIDLVTGDVESLLVSYIHVLNGSRTGTTPRTASGTAASCAAGAASATPTRVAAAAGLGTGRR